MTKRLRVTIVAQRLDCSPRHVRRLIASGQIPAVDISGPDSQRPTWRIPEEGLLSYIAAHGATTASD